MGATRPEAERVLTQVIAKLSDESRDFVPNSSFLSIATAARYLRGYTNESKAARNMENSYKYRRDVRVDDLGTNEDTFEIVWRELEKRSLFLASLTDGATPSSPVLILRKKGEAFDKRDFEEYRSALFFTLNCTAHLADRGLGIDDELLQQTGQWVIVMDMDGYSSKNSPPLKVSIETLKIFQQHFPERAKRIIILDAPTAFNFVWHTVSPFMDPVTRAKVVFVSRSAGEDALKEQVGNIVFDCIKMDLNAGKQGSAQLMIDAELLKPKAEEPPSE